MEKMDAGEIKDDVVDNNGASLTEPVEGDALEYDESAYVMYHRAQTEAPCLSFDVVTDKLGDNREEFPLTCYLVGGTQASRAQANFVIVMKLTNLCKTQKSDDCDVDSDSDSSDDEGSSKKPKFAHCKIRHMGTVNRVRALTVGDSKLAATWSETGRVHVWDLTAAVNNVDSTQSSVSSHPALFTFTGHQSEGYAVDWSTIDKGRLATGDCRHNIHLWQPQSAASWNVDQRPYSAHTASVEDIQWSPSEANVFCSCSVDKSLRIWDVRCAPSDACKITINNAHNSDVNVISWNCKEQHFIASGGDDSVIKVWDLRQYKVGGCKLSPVVSFRYHTAPITSLEWNPNDSSVLAVSAADDRLTIWDFAVEADDIAASSSDTHDDVPAQLLFVHEGQKEIKELHWHSQLPGIIVSTASDAFNIFRTISA